MSKHLEFSINGLTCDELGIINTAVTYLAVQGRAPIPAVYVKQHWDSIMDKIGDAIANGKYVPDEKGGDANDESENRKPRVYDH